MRRPFGSSLYLISSSWAPVSEVRARAAGQEGLVYLESGTCSARRASSATSVKRFWNNCEWTLAAGESTARPTLQRALEDLLDVTRRRGGYSPREFVARRRAKQALRQAEPSRQPSPAIDRGPAGSG
jgi:hypothetical protein